LKPEEIEHTYMNRYWEDTHGKYSKPNAPHDIRLEERPVPKPGPSEVLIEIKAVGVCGSDVHYYEHGRIGSYVVLQPLILGHESAGVIVDVGEGVTISRVGERVAIEPGIPDGVCANPSSQATMR
jgi:L-iditol 2-dehydrogenase